MLQKLNDRIQGVLAWVVIIVIAITFTLFGVDYYLQSRQNASVAVMVNGEPISNHDFEMHYRRARAQRTVANKGLADEKLLKKQVRDQMIANLVTVQAARKLGFDVSIEQANAAIMQIPQFQVEGRFSAERYQQALSSALYTPETFQNEVRQGMLINQLRFSFMGSAFALPEEVSHYVALYMQQRDYSYLRIPVSIFAKTIQIPDAAVEAYYNKNREAFKTPEMVQVSYIALSMQHIKSQITISDDAAKRYYEENKNSYLKPAQWQVAHILYAIPQNASAAQGASAEKKAQVTAQRLQKNPKDFDRLVQGESDDALTKNQHGLLPWITAGQTEFDTALLNLTKSGAIAGPIRTKMGFEVLKLVAYKPASLKPFTQVKAAITDQMTMDLAQTKYTQALEKLTDAAYQSPDSLKPVAQELRLPIKESAFFARAGEKTGIFANKQVINTAFGHDVLGLNNNSEPIQISNDAVIVLRIHHRKPSALEPLPVVKQRITDILVHEQAMTKAKELGTQIQHLDGKAQVDFLANAHLDLAWEIVKSAKRDAEKEDPAINELAFKLARPNNRDSRSVANGDFVIVQLDKIIPGILSSLDKEQQASIKQQIEANYGMMDYDLYVGQLVKQAKIARS